MQTLKQNILKLIIFFIFSFTGVAQADTLDFTEVGSTGIVSTTTINLSNATLTSFGDDFFIGSAGQFGETNSLGIVCASPPNSVNCEASMQIDFLSAITDLTFASFAVSTGDVVDVSAFFGATLLGSLTVTTATLIDFTTFGTIDRLYFADSSLNSSNGIGFGDFNFNVASVPETSTLILLMIGLVGLGFSKRSKSA